MAKAKTIGKAEARTRKPKSSKRRSRTGWWDGAEKDVTAETPEPKKRKTPEKKVVKADKIVPKPKKEKTIRTKRGKVVVEDKNHRDLPESVKAMEMSFDKRTVIGKATASAYEAFAMLNKLTPEQQASALGTLTVYGFFQDWLRKNFPGKEVQEVEVKAEPESVPVSDTLGLAVMGRSQSSVEIKKDAKDVVSFTIKAYADTLEEAEKLAEASFRRLWPDSDE